MELLRRGRARAEFERFVATRSDDLLRTGYLIACDLAEAEDLTQECLLAVARRWQRVRAMENPHGYARRILVNLALDGSAKRSRRRRELQQAAPPAPGTVAPDEYGRVELDCELRAALVALTLRQRTMVVLRYFEDLSESQVADLLDTSTGNVKSTTARALERLRQTLQPSHDHGKAYAPVIPCTDKERTR